MKRFLTRGALLLLLCAALAIPALADSVTDSISVCIGYFGWTEDEYVQKASFSWQELDDWYGGALDTHEEFYSYTNGSGRTYLVFARGFYIRDLLDYAGVDVNSIASIDFFTRDHSNGAYRSFTKYALLDHPRYYFPNLAADPETGTLYTWDGGDDLWVGAYQVEPMLALEDDTEWDTSGFDFESYVDESLFSTGSRFHLFFGQQNPEEAAQKTWPVYAALALSLLSRTRPLPVSSSRSSCSTMLSIRAWTPLPCLRISPASQIMTASAATLFPPCSGPSARASSTAQTASSCPPAPLRAASLQQF